MAITFKSPHEGVSGGWSLQGGKTFKVDVWAECDTPTGPDTVIETAGFKVGDVYSWPLVGTALETNSYLFIQSIDIQPDSEDSLRYKMTVQYGPLNPSQEGTDDGVYDPFAVPPTFRCYGEDEDYYPLVDRDGVPLLNSAGDYLTEIPVKSSVPTFEVGVVVPDFPLAALSGVKGHINASAWQGFEAGTLLCADVNTNRVWDERANLYKWEVTYVFQYKKPVLKTYSSQSVQFTSGWTACVLDAGLRQKVSGKKVPILSEGVPTSEPLPLKADGTAAGPSDNLHFLFFNVIPTADFSVLPIPSGVFS